MIILIILIILLIASFCCYNQYRRRQRDQSLSFSNTIEQTQQEPSLLDPEPQLWVDTRRRWKNFRQGLSPYNHTRTTAAAPADEPPAYEGITFI